MVVNEENVISRRRVFEMAKELVDSVVEQHGLELYRQQSTPFTTTFTATEVEQHLDHIVRVANWLMSEEI